MSIKMVNIAYKWGYNVIREYRMKTGIDTNLPHDFQRSDNINFKVNFQKCAEWPDKSSESFWRCKYANFALGRDPYTEGHA